MAETLFIFLLVTAMIQWTSGQQVYLSLGSTNITTNNTEVLITDIGEDFPDGLPSLTCHTDLTACCRSFETGTVGLGEWYYPDGTVVQSLYWWYNYGNDIEDGFYRQRNAPQVIRLARRVDNNLLTPTGSYCCVIPTTGGEMTFCANITMCPSLPPLTNGMISYSDSTLGVGSVAIHSCDTGYTLNGGSTARTCQSSGSWSGSASNCQAILCLPLLNPTNGVITYNLPHNIYLEGTVATYSCAMSYILIGERNRTCQSDRTWSLPAPYCADQSIVQLKFGPTAYCLHWSEGTEVYLLRKALRKAIKEAVLAVGNHTLPLEHISEGVFSCYGCKKHTIYRTTITGTDTLSADKIVRHVGKWVESGAATQVLWYLVYFDLTCPVCISSMSERECGGDELC